MACFNHLLYYKIKSLTLSVLGATVLLFKNWVKTMYILVYYFRSVYFTGIWLPYVDFQTLRTIFSATEPTFFTRGTGKRLPKFENQSRRARYGSPSLKIKVGEPKAQLR